MSSQPIRSYLVIAAAIIIAGVLISASLFLAIGEGTKTETTTTTVTDTSTLTTTIKTTATNNTTTTAANEAPASINGCGGALVLPLMTSWISTYASVQPNVHVSYTTEGGTMGTASTTTESPCQFGESDTSIASTQYALLPTGSNLLTIPISDSGIVPAYNLPGVTAHLNFTGNVLAEIFYGTVTQWNDPRIASLNPHVTLPAHAIQVYHRSDVSGSTYAFTQYLSDSNYTWRVNLGYGTLVNWPTGTGCLHDDGLAKCVADNQYSIGPLEVAYEIANPGEINYGAVQNHAGNFSLANLHTIQLAMDAGVKNGLPASASQWSSFSVINNIFNDSTDAGIYPITAFTYALIYQSLSASYANTSQAQAVATINFLWWVVNSGQKSGPPLGYPALPSSVVSLDNQVLGSITYGGTPAYTGAPVYTVTFQQIGACSPAVYTVPWSVTLNGVTEARPPNTPLPIANGSYTAGPEQPYYYTIVFTSIPDGVYQYRIAPSGPFTILSGTVTVNGADVSVPVYGPVVACTTTTATA